MTTATAEPITETKTEPGRGPNGRFALGHTFSKGHGTPLSGRVEKMRAFMLQTCEKRIGEVVEVLFDLAINDKQKWAIQEILDRCLGRVPEPPSALTQVNVGALPGALPPPGWVDINLPDPPGGRHVVPGLLDEEP